MARHVATNFTGPLQFPYADAAADIFQRGDVQVLAQAVDQHDHSSGKGLTLPSSAIPAGFITSAMIADGTITSTDILDGTLDTVDLAAHAISQVQLVGGVTNNPSTTSTTFVDLTDMLVNMTTVGGDVLVLLVAQLTNNTVGAGVNLAINRDGGDSAGMSVNTSTVNYSMCLTTIALYPALAAAAHVFKGRWSVTSGTGTAGLTQRYLMVVELKR